MSGRALEDRALIGDDVDIVALRTAASRMASSILEATNEERVAHGLPPLGIDDRLSRAAEQRLRDMYSQRYFAHAAPDGTTPFVHMETAGYRYRSAGENLAKGYTHGRSIVLDWLQSPGHRSNVLGKFYDDIGIAIAPGTPFGQERGATVVVLYGRD